MRMRSGTMSWRYGRASRAAGGGGAGGGGRRCRRRATVTIRPVATASRDRRPARGTARQATGGRNPSKRGTRGAGRRGEETAPDTDRRAADGQGLVIVGLLSIGLIAQLAIVSHATLDTAAPVNFHAMVLPETVYVGQQVTYQVGVFLDDELRLRLRRNPEFVPPEPQAMLTYDLPTTSGAAPTRRVGTHEYEVHVFQRAMFPLEAGHYTIPAAQLSYSLPLSLSFFSREESHTLAAESLSVIALAPPAVGRPADYTGAVGELHAGARLDMRRVRVGDPVLVTVAVAGRANVKLLPRPALVVPWGSVVVGQERVQVDTSSTEVRGTKEFDWVVTPRDTGALVLPSVRYPYFDPYTERYEVAVTDPATLVVGEGTLAPVDSVRADAPSPLAVRTVYHGEVPRPPYSTPGFALLAVCAPLPALAITAGRRTRARRRGGAAPAGGVRRTATA